jgi:hypothetical protein
VECQLHHAKHGVCRLARYLLIEIRQHISDPYSQACFLFIHPKVFYRTVLSKGFPSQVDDRWLAIIGGLATVALPAYQDYTGTRKV